MFRLGPNLPAMASTGLVASQKADINDSSPHVVAALDLSQPFAMSSSPLQKDHWRQRDLDCDVEDSNPPAYEAIAADKVAATAVGQDFNAASYDMTTGPYADADKAHAGDFTVLTLSAEDFIYFPSDDESSIVSCSSGIFSVAHSSDSSSAPAKLSYKASLSQDVTVQRPSQDMQAYLFTEKVSRWLHKIPETDLCDHSVTTDETEGLRPRQPAD